MSKHIKFLDGFRGVAILLVLCTHMALPQLNGGFYTKFLFNPLKTGWIGVDMFFVLSGFLITSILWKNKEQSTGSYFKGFYGKRLVRIFPLYYLILILIFFVFSRMGEIGEVWREKITIIPTWHYFLHFQNFSIAKINQWPGPVGITWSLAVEEHFYFVWPVLVFLLNKKQLNYLIVAILISSPIIRFFTARIIEGEIGVYTYSFCRMDALCFGGLLALNRQSLNTKLLKYLFALSLIFILIMFTIDGKYLKYNPFVYTIGYSCNYLLFGSILGLLLNGQFQKLKKLLENDFLGKMGLYSYSIYLFHPLLVSYMEFHLNKFQLQLNTLEWMIVQVIFGIVLIFICYGCGYMIYQLFEKHMLKLKKHFEY